MKKNIIPAFTLLVLITIACGSSAPVLTTDAFVKEYGGNPVVYDEIFSLSDCAVLQKKFDTASANNAREEPGTPASKWTTGYMVAANERMKELDCYK